MIRPVQTLRCNFNADHFLNLLEVDLSASQFDSASVGYAKSRFLNRMRKKYCPTGLRNIEADHAAINKFLSVNQNQRPIHLESELLGNAQDFIWAVLERGTRLLSTRVGNVSPQQVLDLPTVFSHWNIGGGANNAASGTHFCEKMEGPLSYSNKAASYLGYLAYVSPTVFTRHSNGRVGFVGVSKVRGSKVSTVPKTPDVSRVIATEPTLNMCCQLAAGNFFAACLKLCGLDISRQQVRNNALAKLGSVRGDDIGLRLCTLDLESASDRITPALVKLLFPPEWYHFLMDIRSESASIPEIGEVQLSMMSTMGNGFTFALMTLINTALVYSVNRFYLGTRRNAIDWSRNGVYGDDIIVDNTVASQIVSILGACGLVVNNDKSYDTGYFRESCGGDYYNGYDVTPVYIKSLVTQAERLIAINQLLKWSRKHNVILYSLSYLMNGVDGKNRNAVPEWEDDYAGIKTSDYLPSYVALRCKLEPVTYTGKIPFACALGGYVLPNEDSMVFTPREAKVRWYRQKVINVFSSQVPDYILLQRIESGGRLRMSR